MPVSLATVVGDLGNPGCCLMFRREQRRGARQEGVPFRSHERTGLIVWRQERELRMPRIVRIVRIVCPRITHPPCPGIRDSRCGPALPAVRVQCATNVRWAERLAVWPGGEIPCRLTPGEQSVWALRDTMTNRQECRR